jgi:serine/threonine protein kinase
MKQVCLQCKRIQFNGHAWCQDRVCDVSHMPTILDNGEWLGDIEVVKLVVALPTAVIYKALRHNRHVFLKVAHAGHEERLKHEARFLQSLAEVKRSHSMLPTLLPAHQGVDLSLYPYGRGIMHGQPHYYSVLAYTEGTVLSELLARNAQPWFQHVGWLTLSLADAIGFLHNQGKLHLSLMPDILLVRFDRDNVPRLTLLDLGFLCDAGQPGFNGDVASRDTGYVAPELLVSGIHAGAASDVYGLGLILYQMLAGAPAYSGNQVGNGQVSLVQEEPVPLNRPDLKNVPDIARQAISRQPEFRQPDIPALFAELQQNFPLVPKERQEINIDWQAVTVVAGALLAIALLILLATSLAAVA